MSTTNGDKRTRVEALTRLAIATRAEIDRVQVFAVYLDDTSRVSTPHLVEACHRLEKSATWFPKVSELLEECRIVREAHERREAEKRPKLNAADFHASPESIAKFNREWQALMRAKRMRSA